jgi:hypothetical protein
MEEHNVSLLLSDALNKNSKYKSLHPLNICFKLEEESDAE